ncbi:hypothetical protein DWX10_06445 [Clostridium sp. AF18-27]|uniref:hypothetical protein n=1 Tax=Enterocloster lavalensis TaxID=460384 RepID=UPI000E4A892B|nr:hypothetical protein [Enterocloster lavalensis]RHR56333.1 hypothetical protein DWX10_06445 [Clostridium sp. AF18-27]
MPSKSIEYKGKQYASKLALCQEYGISTSMLINRMKSGWSLEEALETQVGEKSTNGVPVVFEGIRYPSVKSLAKELELPYSSLLHFYERKNDIQEAVECCRTFGRQELELWGKRYDSLADIAHQFGLSYYRLLSRTEQGVGVEEIVKEALEKEPVTFRGKEYSHFVDLCAAFQVQPANVYERLRYGLGLEEALTKPIKKMGNKTPVSYRGSNYESQIALCRVYGISVGSVREQMRTNPLSFLEVFDTFVQLKERVGWGKEQMISYIPHCAVRGKAYKTVRALLREIGIRPSAFYTYKDRGGFEDVFEALKAMQKEMRVAYLVDGEPQFSVDIRQKKYSRSRMNEIMEAKVKVPRYPTLQGLDFDAGCYDTERIYYEILNRKLQEQEPKWELHME